MYLTLIYESNKLFWVWKLKTLQELCLNLCVQITKQSSTNIWTWWKSGSETPALMRFVTRYTPIHSSSTCLKQYIKHNSSCDEMQKLKATESRIRGSSRSTGNKWSQKRTILVLHTNDITAGGGLQGIEVAVGEKFHSQKHILFSGLFRLDDF